MGIRFYCPQCQNRLHVKSFLAGKRGVCPKCGAKIDIPAESELADDEKEIAAPIAHPQTAHNEAAPHTAARTLTMEAKTRARTTAGPQSNPIVTAPAKNHAPQQPGPVPEPAASAAAETIERSPAVTKPAAPVSADPLQESPQSVWYVRPPSGGQFGPARAEVMQRWIQEGRVTPDSLVWREGWPDWRIASDVLPNLNATAVAPAPNAVAETAVAAAPSAAGTPKIVPAPAIPAVAAASVMRYQKKKRERRGIWTAAVILLSLLAVTLIVTLIIVLRRT